MNTKDYFKDIYQDFFGVEETKKEEISQNNSIKKGSQEEMTDLFDRINKLYIREEDKDTIKKMIEYMRKYQEEIEKNYIPFRIIISANNKETIKEISDILYKASIYFNYIDNDKKGLYSFYKMDKDISFTDTYFLEFNNIDGILIEDITKQKKIIHEITEYFNNNSHYIVIFADNKNHIEQFFIGREELKNQYFDFEIEGINPDIQDIYQNIIDKVNINDETKITLLDYMSKTYAEDKDYIKYENDLINYISFHKEIPKLEENKNLDEIFKELNELVGLEKVKRVLHELVDVMTLKEKAGDSLKIKDMNLHMVFLGNPGTGKTTIARLISGILYNLGYIKENKLIEVGVKDLVAEYVGQTAPKTMNIIEKSLNGVLFIDEAYSLAVKGDNGYNAEAIATLIQAMENYRDKLVVIFAGYTKEMQDFLNSNSGIVSRIGYTLEFDDYTTEELIQIFLNFMNKSGFEVTNDAIEYLKTIIDKNRNMKNFGNARFVRNIYEKSIVKHASRVKNNKQKRILKTITKDDISIENLILK